MSLRLVAGVGKPALKHNSCRPRATCERGGEGAPDAPALARAAVFVEWIGGDYTNVVGLPLALSVRMLEGFGIYWY